MDVLPIIYLTYMFISIYFLILFLMLYFKNKGRFFENPIAEKNYSVSFVIPAYNEGKTIADCIEHVFNIDYDNIIEVIVVNDCSTDNTREVLENLKKKYPKLIVINNPKNLGNAAKSQNVGLEYARGELIAIVDADSFPARDSIKKMAGFFNDSKVGAVTCPVLARNKEKFWEKLQAIEYTTISFQRKLLEYVDSIYVTPGPLALYRKEALISIRGFDEKNLTQDIEATWHITANGWDRKMALSTYVTSQVPSKFWDWWVQRRRWDIGGLQCIKKYFKHIGKKDMLGIFIVPFFAANIFLGMLGLLIFFYLLIANSISKFLFAKYSIYAGTSMVTINEFFITPNFLNYLGVFMFVFGYTFLLLTLAVLKEKIWKKENILNIPFYSIVYLIIYPFILADAIGHIIIGKKAWG